MKNGWGVVARLQDGAIFASGEVPVELRHSFCARRAYIYFLEIYAQVLSAIFLRRRLGSMWISFIDSTAGHSALLRGYGRDASINRLIAFTWALFAELRMFPHFEWVSSACNLSDGVSRHDLKYAFEAGWSQQEFDVAPLLKIFRRVSVDLEFAIAEAVDLVLNFISTRP